MSNIHLIKNAYKAKDEIESVVNDMIDEIKSLEEKIAELEVENEKLRAELQELK